MATSGKNPKYFTRTDFERFLAGRKPKIAPDLPHRGVDRERERDNERRGRRGEQEGAARS